MKTNHSKIYPNSGIEHDVVYARDIYKYLKNNPIITKFIKRQMNKRFRRFNNNVSNFT